MTQLLTQNRKLKETSKLNGIKIMNFGLPAYESAQGDKICPLADVCVAFCYARKYAYTWPNVKNAYEYRYQQSLLDSFADEISKELDRKKPEILRIHDSGDYYSKKYLAKWIKVWERFPEIHFYSYTNMIPFFRDRYYANNFTAIFSDSGKWSHTIDKSFERHTKIFKTLEDLQKEGYANASKNDLVAIGDNHKIGLVYH